MIFVLALRITGAKAPQLSFHELFEGDAATPEITGFKLPDDAAEDSFSLLPILKGTNGGRNVRPTLVIQADAKLAWVQPHMHLRGKAMMVEAILPNGTQQVLGYVSNFEFNWMNNYVFDDDYAPLLPKGTILKITAWHDNTAAKKSNPDPTQWIGWGDRTVDEMAHAWINITYMNDDDFQKEVDTRKAKMGTTTDRQQQQQQ